MKKAIHFQETLITLGNNLHSIRNMRKETLNMIAKAIGVTHPVLSRIENGRYEAIQLNIIIQLCNYYGITLQQAFSPDMTTIFQLVQNHSDGSQQLVSQALSEGFEYALNQFKNEIDFLREQNSILLNLMEYKK